MRVSQIPGLLGKVRQLPAGTASLWKAAKTIPGSARSLGSRLAGAIRSKRAGKPPAKAVQASERQHLIDALLLRFHWDALDIGLEKRHPGLAGRCQNQHIHRSVGADDRVIVLP